MSYRSPGDGSQRVGPSPLPRASAGERDRRVALLAGGPNGLTLEGIATNPDLPNPTSLALASIGGDALGIYAASEGQETAILLTFLATPEAPGLTLLPPGDVSLPLIATLLTVGIDSPDGPSGNPAEAEGSGPSFGQSLLAKAGGHNGDFESDDTEAEAEPSVVPQAADAPGPSAWARSVLGLEEAFDQILREDRVRTPLNPTPGRNATGTPPPLDEPGDRPEPDPLRGDGRPPGWLVRRILPEAAWHSRMASLPGPTPTLRTMGVGVARPNLWLCTKV